METYDEMRAQRDEARRVADELRACYEDASASVARLTGEAEENGQRIAYLEGMVGRLQDLRSGEDLEDARQMARVAVAQQRYEDAMKRLEQSTAAEETRSDTLLKVVRLLIERLA